jgi:hypothetical protein
MAENTDWAVAFAGPGDASPNNVSDLLDNWWKDVPEEADFTLILPDKITRAQKGLGNVAAYIGDIFGDEKDDGFVTQKVSDLVDRLVHERDVEGKQAYLVLLVGEEIDDEGVSLLEAATNAGIPVKDLTSGLDDLEFSAEETEVVPDVPETPAAAPSRRRRSPGKASTPEAVTEAPKRRGRPRKEQPAEHAAVVEKVAAEVDAVVSEAAKVYDVATGVNADDDPKPVTLNEVRSLIGTVVEESVRKVLKELLTAL